MPNLTVAEFNKCRVRTYLLKIHRLVILKNNIFKSYYTIYTITLISSLCKNVTIHLNTFRLMFCANLSCISSLVLKMKCLKIACPEVLEKSPMSVLYFDFFFLCIRALSFISRNLISLQQRTICARFG